MVSMALGAGAPSIPSETLERIRLAALELGYEPNRFAQALRTNRTRTIACLVPDIANPFYPTLIKGLMSVADAEQYDVIAVNTDGQETRERHYLSWARQGHIDGIVGVFFHVRVPDFRPLLSMGIPVVRIESSRKSGGTWPIDDIFIDNRQASLEMTQYLIRRGHKWISMLAGRGGPQLARIEGYQLAMKLAGLSATIFVKEAFNEIDGYNGGLEILNQPTRPSAIFAANDLLAIGVMSAAKELNLTIPGDLAVVGFDDIPPARMVSPPLTTIANNQFEIGKRSARLLIERLRSASSEEGAAVEMPFNLIERGSA